LPVSTEQILHPERYPSDMPQPVTVPDLAGRLGPAWSDLYIEDVGEDWLRVLLELRLSSVEAEDAAAGWDGARYRAWTDGTHTAVLLESVWDTLGDASEFAGTLRTWAGSRPVLVELDGQRVNGMFGSDGATLSGLRAAAG
jgi:hypothetical protein